jgi:hypothetical protein
LSSTMVPSCPPPGGPLSAPDDDDRDTDALMMQPEDSPLRVYSPPVLLCAIHPQQVNMVTSPGQGPEQLEQKILCSFPPPGAASASLLLVGNGWRPRTPRWSAPHEAGPPISSLPVPLCTTPPPRQVGMAASPGLGSEQLYARSLPAGSPLCLSRWRVMGGVHGHRDGGIPMRQAPWSPPPRCLCAPPLHPSRSTWSPPRAWVLSSLKKNILCSFPPCGTAFVSLTLVDDGWRPRQDERMPRWSVTGGVGVRGCARGYRPARLSRRRCGRGCDALRCVHI